MGLGQLRVLRGVKKAKDQQLGPAGEAHRCPDRALE